MIQILALNLLISKFVDLIFNLNFDFQSKLILLAKIQIFDQNLDV